MKNVVFIIMLCLTFNFLSFSQDLNAIFEKANHFYINKNYTKALEEYKKIEKEIGEKNKHSFKLYYNLGCTYFRLNDIANARYYFEKAKRIKPFDKDLNKNLKLILTRLKDKEKKVTNGFFVNIYKKLYLSVSLNALTLITLIFFLAVFLILAMLIANRYDRKKLYYSLGISLFFFLLSFSLFYSRYKYTFQKEGIVFSEEVDVFSEPNTSSTILFKLHKAAKVKIEEQLNGYVHISLPDGLNGWIDRQYIKEI
ncbi:aerotolerance-related exported protein BatE [Thermotomaculum hydrothermale]|uniref:Aerotolerance-related exported protein BatE n=1 Tax=Thermotomaculum hydrothermale TaxID=981385 RepID=A0A7R6SY58_9BACT|nr:tetratricopeptide repeat protein [Thermotomaculum hydrothermale]BBB32290.1 aerotolerance-related exported protein BatE [Thermotomaculum hydrothermale]